MWIKTTTQGNLIGLQDSLTGPSSTNYDRRMYVGTDNKLYGATYNGSSWQAATSTATVTDGLKHHVVNTFDSGGSKVYIDGALAGSNSSATISGSYTAYYVGAGNARTTGVPNFPTNAYINANISNVAVYTTSLSAARILAHYNAGII